MMKSCLKIGLWMICGAVVCGIGVKAQIQKPIVAVSELNVPTVAGRAVNLDAQGKLLPWPMAENTGYSYAGYFESQGPDLGPVQSSAVAVFLLLF